MTERPVLTYREGRWTTDLYPIESPELIAHELDRMSFVVHPQAHFKHWLLENDPNHRIVSFSHMMVVEFSDENAAMAFRLLTDAEIERV